MPLEWAHVPRRLDHQDAGPRRSPAQPRRVNGRTVLPLTRQPNGAQPGRSSSPLASRRRSRARTTATSGCYVLSGRMRLVLGDRDLVLDVGEAAEFDTQLPHWFGSTGEGPAEVLSIFGRPGERMHVRARSRDRNRRSDRLAEAAPAPCCRPSSTRPGSTRGLVPGRGWRPAAGGGTRPGCCSSPLLPASASRRCSRSRCSTAPGPHHGLAVPGRGRQRPGDVLDLRGRGAAYGGARTSARPRPPSWSRPARPITTVLTSLLNELAAADAEVVLVLDDYHVIDDRRDPRGDGVPARPPPRAAAPGHRQPGRPAAAARPAAGAGRAGRGTGGRPAVHRRRGGGVLRRHGPAPRRRRRRRPRGPDRGLDRRPPARRPVAARARRRRRRSSTGFAGDDRYVVDYLVEEVVQRQPEDVRDFLLRDLRSWTGCPVRCATPSPGSTAAAPGSRRSTGTTCSWCRSTTAASGTATTTSSPTCCAPGSSTSTPSEVPDLHRRASVWHERGRRHDGRDRARAGRRRLGPGRRPRGDRHPGADQGATRGPAPALDGGAPRGGLRLPTGAGERLRRRPDVHRRDPRGRAPAADRRALGGGGAAEPAGTLPAGLLVALPDQFRKLPGWIKIHRAGLALMVGDVAATVDHAREAIAVLDPDDDLGHGAATALMGLASWRQGDLAAAEAAYAETMRRFEHVGLRRRRPRLRHHAGRPAADPGPAPGRGAHLPRRARPRRAPDRPGPCAARRTCTSG